MQKTTIVVLDSFGLGATDDATRFGDEGANTLGSIADYCVTTRHQPLRLPNLARLGLFDAAEESCGEYPRGCRRPAQIDGSYGHAAEMSSGKDTPSGHWEIAGVPVLFDWGYFEKTEDTFPDELLQRLIVEAQLPGIIGNCHASGTVIIEQLGVEHMTTGKPIVYTSADSVIQIACHEGTFGLERLYDTCLAARKIVDDYNVGRVIARPFVGDAPGNFKRTGNRRDLTVPPHSATLLDKLVADGGDVISVGKIADIFAHQGVTKKVKADGNPALIDATLEAMDSASERSIVFTNLVDFDMLYGHRRDPEGYATALEYFDSRLPELLSRIGNGDLLVLCADHGCDPTFEGTDHTREHIPVLVFGGEFKGESLGRRSTFADIGQTLAEYFQLSPMEHGTSFLPR